MDRMSRAQRVKALRHLADYRPFAWIAPGACPVLENYCLSLGEDLVTHERGRLHVVRERRSTARALPEVEQRRALLCADWATRVFEPAVSRRAGDVGRAERLAGLPPITTREQARAVEAIIPAAHFACHTYSVASVGVAAGWAAGFAIRLAHGDGDAAGATAMLGEAIALAEAMLALQPAASEPR